MKKLALLGDAKLHCWLTEELCDPCRSPEEVTNIRQSLEANSSLADLARQNGLAPKIKLGEGAESQRSSKQVLADAFEAVIGALCLDRGDAVARAAVLPLFFPETEGTSILDMAESLSR